MSDKKPVIFISYAHADEPEKPAEGEIKWLSFVQRYLQPAVKNGIFDLWVDRNMLGGADWDPEIEQKLRACDIFVLLVSANSMASDYIIDKEIAIIRERQANRENVHFYPLLLTPTPDAGLNKVKDKNLRPRDARPFSSFSYNDRLQHMTDAVNEIGKIAQHIIQQKGALTPSAPVSSPPYVHTTNLPETAYENLVGRETELKRLDDAWSDRGINILSLVAEGGAGKSALVNEWLKILQVENYRGAELVLGWSFYSQGTKERATSAEQFLDWAIEKLDIEIETTSATAKGDAIAEALAKRRVLLVLDGCEPLQHGLDKQQGDLKDQGLRALVRRFAATPPAEAHGLVVLTSRLPVKDIGRWKDAAAPVHNVEQLSDKAGAALLRDNRVWGTHKELHAAVRDFGGHPLALALLASLLNETQFGDVRRRDHIRAFFADPENPSHDHARRVMESYETEWLIGKPVEYAIMRVVGLFDRPASSDCLRTLRKKPAILGLNEAIVDSDDREWRRAVARLRAARLLSPADSAMPDALDAHPLVREWFSDKLSRTDSNAWRAAHSRLYDHLRRATREGDHPTLEQLGPLYQSISHGCQAGRHVDAFERIFLNRLCRVTVDGPEGYTYHQLGAVSSDLAAMSWFFDGSIGEPVAVLGSEAQGFILNHTSVCLKAQGRFSEALPLMEKAVHFAESTGSKRNMAAILVNLGISQLALGNIKSAAASLKKAISYADQGAQKFITVVARAAYASAVGMSGERDQAAQLFVDAEGTGKTSQNEFLVSTEGYLYWDFLLNERKWDAAYGRAETSKRVLQGQTGPLALALADLTLGRAQHGRALEDDIHPKRISGVDFNNSVQNLRSAGQSDMLCSGLIARAALRRSAGDWNGCKQDIEEVLEIAGPGPMRPLLCDVTLEYSRLIFAKIEAFAPLREVIDDSLPIPVVPNAVEMAGLKDEAAKQLIIAADHIRACHYYFRDEELAELEAVLRGERKFADLPPRV